MSVLKTENKNGKRYFSEVGRYIWINPIQMWRDAHGLAKINIIPLLQRAREQNKKLHIICSEDDRVFPFSKIKKQINSIFPVHKLKGGHDELFFSPEKYANYINNLLKKDKNEN